MGANWLTLVATCLGRPAIADNFSYEADALPENSGWIIDNIWCDPGLWLDAGWFYQHVDLCPGDDPPGGQSATYRRSLADFDGAPDFYVEWRVQSDAPRSELFPWAGGAKLSIGGYGGVHYLSLIVSDQAELHRDNRIPFVFVDLDPAVPHTYRVELHGSQHYAWYIDGQVADAGVPEGQFPSAEPAIGWAAYAAWGPSTQRWDYIRYGRIPPIVPGDLNCDGAINNLDIDPFVQALADPNGYSAEHAACNRLNADTNRDGLVNNFDIDPFVALLVGGP